MEAIPPLSRQAQFSISRAISFLKRGDKRMAARELEASFLAVQPILFAAADLRAASEAISEGAEQIIIHDTPMRYDWLYYANAALTLGLASLCSDERFLKAIGQVEIGHPRLTEPSWLVAQYSGLRTESTHLYQTIVTSFRDGIARLAPRDAYGALQNIASELAIDDVPEIENASGLRHASPDTRFRSSQGLLMQLARARDAYRRKDLEEVKRTASGIAADSDGASDSWTSIDAEHLLARVQFDEKCLAQAEQSLLRIMGRAQRVRYQDGLVRALHELSRVKAAKVEIIEAEAGFRLALEYYTLRASRRNAEGDNSSTGALDLMNLEAALKCLAGIADLYFQLTTGPVDAVRVMDNLSSEFVSSRDSSGYDFLEIRGLALNLLTRSAQGAHTANLVAKAMALYAEQRVLSLYALDEASWICDQRGISYPTTLKKILAQPGQLLLRSTPSYKPCVECRWSTDAGLRHCTTGDAAESIEDLYAYLADLDNQGRYVYRGQVREYEGPLLPSAFRPIFMNPCPARTISLAAVGAATRLRRCGESFVGEYNDCFRCYADVMKNARERGAGEAEIERIFSIYRKLLDDPGIALRQDEAEFMPWHTAVQRELSQADFETYQENATDWDLRINNYHRRLFRDMVLVRIFGYALGTTFAQQYGFSSEGLDASKSLDVACFFATHDSPAFQSILREGVGIIYRFPFPPDNIAAHPLSESDYYNLPPVVDVDDVFYRFEQGELDERESMALMRCYLTAAMTYHLQTTDLLLLPRGCLTSSRIRRQEPVILLPDEIRADEPNRQAGPGGVKFPKYRYIEDLGSRPGVVRFYFKHTGVWPERLQPITREHLWPRCDFLLEAFISLLASSYRLRQAIPKRLDLIDGGHSSTEFQPLCHELYKTHKHQFFTGFEQVARGNAALIF